MKIGVLGGGPAGLYFALLAKRTEPSHEVRVIERNPPDATFGWGVVFSEETLGALRDADLESYDRITQAWARWSAIDVVFRGRRVRSRGHRFSAISRKVLLQILQERCREVGVELAFERELPDLSAFDSDDLVVAADGVNSTVRRGLDLGTTVDAHASKYVWFGTDLVFDAFTFVFRETERGMFQVHAYPFDAETSTFIVECNDATWRRAGLEGSGEEDTMAFCQDLFAPELEGHKLMSNRSVWMTFTTVRNEAWHRDNVVLAGDAAHTAHFTIGSGTKLAMEDAIALRDALVRHPGDLERALVEYEMDRQPVVERFQEAARESATYFENVIRYGAFEPVRFAFNLLTRSGRITHLELARRDPDFVASVDALFAGRPGAVVAPPPMLVPLRLRERDLPNRVATTAALDDAAAGGRPGEGFSERQADGCGLVLTGFVAVSADGRITPGTPGLYEDEHVGAWRDAIARIGGGGGPAVGVRLGHAGRRGATRPRQGGLDRPLPEEEAWPLLAPSPLPYTSRSAVPADAVERRDELLADFAAASRRAADAGFDLIELDLSGGYLLASFLSPLSNRRDDGYGGSLEGRMRFPLEVFGAVREAWPADRPVAVRLTVTDWHPSGLTPEEAVVVARALRERACDLVEVAAGGTVPFDRPQYGRMFLVPFADRVRNDVGLPVLVGGGITTADEVNTILAAGRADLCILTPRRSAEG